jgi:hypothetical protein
MENTYVPPQPINDEDRKSWFTNFDQKRMDRIIAIKMNQITANPVKNEC